MRLGVLASLLLTGCTVGPDYVPPTSTTPVAYKDTGIWKQATPSDGLIRGKWWEVYRDPQLNALEEQVNINNQNVLQAEANFRAAAASVKIARAGWFPTITANPSMTESQSSRANSSSGNFNNNGNGAMSQYNLPLEATYLADVWGAVRRNVEANTATAQASFADLENARLSYQATLAGNYFTLRGIDAQEELLRITVESYQKYLELTQNRYNSGISSKGDVAQATTQLMNAKRQLIELGVQRAQFEDAIATLIGKPAPMFSLNKRALTATPPTVPVGVPSTLLERRPDIAGAQRRVASANATIGVAVSAYYPAITLSASTGMQAIHLADLFSGPAFVWSVGPAVAQTLFNGGQTHGQVQEARAQYEATVAVYRQTVLTAFQQVQDNLSGLRILSDEAVVAEQGVAASKQSLEIQTNQYKAGTVDYISVTVAQAAALNDQLAAVNIRTRRMTTSVLLVEALGGGWTMAKLPGTKAVADVPQAEKAIKGK